MDSYSQATTLKVSTKIIGNMPINISTVFRDWETTKQQKKQIAAKGYLDAIEAYSRQVLFPTYGSYATGGMVLGGITNDEAKDVLELLLLGANVGKSAACQFMLGCLYSGNNSIREINDEGIEVECQTPSDYRYFNIGKAAEYYVKYLDNTDKDTMPFGYTEEEAMKLIRNVFPNMNAIETARKRLESIKQACSKGIENSAPTFSLE